MLEGTIFFLSSSAVLQVLCRNKSVFGAVHDSLPAPAGRKQPHFAMLPPPCFTVGCGVLSAMSFLVFAPHIFFFFIIVIWDDIGGA